MLAPEKQRAIATETLEIYAPLANRLGVQEIKWELEDLSFKTLHPGPYREIARLVEKRRGERQELIDEVIAATARQAEGARRQGRGRGPPEAPVLDLREDGDPRQGVQRDLRPGRRADPRRQPPRHATRRSAPCIRCGSRCPAASRTTSRCPSRTCTSRCTRRWSGPAARRWRSRSARATCTAPRSSASPRTGATRRAAKQAKDAADIAWLGQMMEWLKDMADPREFMEGLKIDLYGGQVFVFTPKGDVVNLPAGRDAGGLRVRDPHRRRAPHDRREGRAASSCPSTTSCGRATRSRC